MRGQFSNSTTLKVKLLLRARAYKARKRAVTLHPNQSSRIWLKSKQIHLHPVFNPSTNHNKRKVHSKRQRNQIIPLQSLMKIKINLSPKYSPLIQLKKQSHKHSHINSISKSLTWNQMKRNSHKVCWTTFRAPQVRQIHSWIWQMHQVQLKPPMSQLSQIQIRLISQFHINLAFPAHFSSEILILKIRIHKSFLLAHPQLINSTLESLIM